MHPHIWPDLVDEPKAAASREPDTAPGVAMVHQPLLNEQKQYDRRVLDAENNMTVVYCMQMQYEYSSNF